MPPNKADWRGGTVTFTMQVDSKRTNYFTAKFWGSDVTGEESRLMLFLDGKQIGQRHLGEVEQLDIMTVEPRYNEPWSVAYQKPEVVEKVAKGLDHTYQVYLKEKDGDGIGKRWVGYGPAGVWVGFSVGRPTPWQGGLAGRGRG